MLVAVRMWARARTRVQDNAKGGPERPRGHIVMVCMGMSRAISYLGCVAVARRYPSDWDPSMRWIVASDRS